MKKLFLATACLLCSFAANATPEEQNEPIAAQYIMTDCGTVYQIPVDATEEEVCNYIDILSELDC